MSTSIGIVIPTFQGSKHLPYCLPPLLNSSLKPRILVVDSSSTDDTAMIARSMGVETLVFSQSEFNHGLTREKGRQHLRTPIVVMLTQDAYLASSEMLSHLIKPLIKKEASIAYARQLPRLDASLFEAFSRHFNYPAKSHIRSLADSSLYGAYTFFCSNSCAAYLNCALDEIGGFPSVLFGEDFVVTAKLLHRQHRIAYVAEAQVYHSHDYALIEEFCRHFDIGLSRRMYQEILSISGSDSQRGKAYVQSLLRELWKTSPSKIPYALLQTFVKWSGYYLGKLSLNAPNKWKKKFSGQKFYWERLK